jgi:hypothetical protein
MAALAAIAWASWRRGVALVVAPALLVMSLLIRPGAAFVVATLGALWLFAWRAERRPAKWLALAAALAIVGATPLVAWSLALSGGPVWLGQLTAIETSMPEGGAFHFGPRAIAVAFAGLLVSPARGAIVYAPLFILALIVGARGGRDTRVVALGMTAHLIFVSTSSSWSGGWAFGPRLLSEALWIAPWAIVVARFGEERRPRAILAATCALTLAVGVVGAFRYEIAAWDLRRDPDHHPEAIWDVRDNPLAAAIRGTPARAVDAPSGPFAYCVDDDITLRRVRLR